MEVRKEGEIVGENPNKRMKLEDEEENEIVEKKEDEEDGEENVEVRKDVKVNIERKKNDTVDLFDDDDVDGVSLSLTSDSLLPLSTVSQISAAILRLKVYTDNKNWSVLRTLKEDINLMWKVLESKCDEIGKYLLFTFAGSTVVPRRGGLFPIKREDILRLTELNWLNDQVIQYFFDCFRLEHGTPQKLIMDIILVTRNVMNNIESDCQLHLFNSIYLSNVYEIYFPIHISDHFVLVRADFQRQELIYYDSMKKGTKYIACIISKVVKYLDLLFAYKGFKPFAWKNTSADCPQQSNTNDCGVFMCMALSSLYVNTPLVHTQADMPQYRIKMAVDILCKSSLFSSSTPLDHQGLKSGLNLHVPTLHSLINISSMDLSNEAEITSFLQTKFDLSKIDKVIEENDCVDIVIRECFAVLKVLFEDCVVSAKLRRFDDCKGEIFMNFIHKYMTGLF